MRRIKLECFLLALVLLISGCSNVPPSSTESPTNSTSTESPTNSTADDVFIIPDIPEVSLDPVSLLAEGIYCTGGNYDIGIYPFSCVRSFTVDLISKTPIPEDATVSLDTAISYRSSIMEVKPMGTVEMQYPYYLYQCAKGTDWPKMTKAYLKAQYAIHERGNLLRQGITPTQEQEERWKQDGDAYNLMFYACREDYLAQIEQWKAAEEPAFYQYRIGVSFIGWDGSISDVISEVTLTYGGKTLTIPVGNIHLDGTAARRYPFGNGVKQKVLAISEYPGGTPWSSEYLEISAPIAIEAKEKITIKNLYVYNNTAEIAKCIVNLTSMDVSVDQAWSPGTDTIELQEGDNLTFYITIQDKALMKREYEKNMVLICEYEQEGETYCCSIDVQVIRRREPYEVFLWAFEGVNTQAYYQQYFNIVNSVTFEGE